MKIYKVILAGCATFFCLEAQATETINMTDDEKMLAYNKTAPFTEDDKKTLKSIIDDPTTKITLHLPERYQLQYVRTPVSKEDYFKNPSAYTAYSHWTDTYEKVTTVSSGSYMQGYQQNFSPDLYTKGVWTVDGLLMNFDYKVDNGTYDSNKEPTITVQCLAPRKDLRTLLQQYTQANNANKNFKLTLINPDPTKD
jgi:hypothetical protein